jgi:hypothetical protein
VTRKPRGERRPCPMRIPRARTWLATCALAAATPARPLLEIERELSRDPLHEGRLTPRCDSRGHDHLDLRDVSRIHGVQTGNMGNARHLTGCGETPLIATARAVEGGWG